MSKTIKILTISSICLNIFLIGIIIGQMSNHMFRKNFHWKTPPEIGLKLSPDKGKVFLDTMKKVFRENDNIRKQLDEEREKILSILSQPQFDEKAYQAEVTKVDKLHNLMMERLAEATKELAKQFNQEERKALAEHLRQPPPFPPWGSPPPGEGPPPPPPEEPPPRPMP